MSSVEFARCRTRDFSMTDREYHFANWDRGPQAKCCEKLKVKNLVSETIVEDRYGFVKGKFVIWHDGLVTQYVSKGKAESARFRSI